MLRRAVVAIERVVPSVGVVVPAQASVQVQVAVLIEVGEGGPVALAEAAGAGRGRNVGKGAVAQVAEERVGFETGHLRAAVGEVNIDEAVVVYIAHTRAHTAERALEAGRGRDVGKGAVAQVAIEKGPVRLNGLTGDHAVEDIGKGAHSGSK